MLFVYKFFKTDRENVIKQSQECRNDNTDTDYKDGIVLGFIFGRPSNFLHFHNSSLDVINN